MLLFEKRTENGQVDIIYGRFTHDQTHADYTLPKLGTISCQKTN